MVEKTTSSDRDVPHQPSSGVADADPSATGTTADGSARGKVTTEGSARVLNEVKGRLERIETGELPVIERIGADGTTRRVDPTGEMIRPDTAHLAAVNEAAEQFAAQHRAADASSPAASPAAAVTSAPVGSESDADPVPARTGLWARIIAWFRRG